MQHQNIGKTRILLLSLLLSFLTAGVFFMAACGSGGGGSDGAGVINDDSNPVNEPDVAKDVKTGGVAFKIDWGESGPKAREMSGISAPCDEISMISVEIYDASDNLLVKGGPWPCEDREGTVSGVPVGEHRQVLMIAENNSGEPIFWGEAFHIDVQQGRVSDAGVIRAHNINVPVKDLLDNGLAKLKDGERDEMLDARIYLKGARVRARAASQAEGHEADAARFFHVISRLMSLYYDMRPDGTNDEGFLDFGDVLDGFGFSDVGRLPMDQEHYDTQMYWAEQTLPGVLGSLFYVQSGETRHLELIGEVPEGKTLKAFKFKLRYDPAVAMISDLAATDGSPFSITFNHEPKTGTIIFNGFSADGVGDEYTSSFVPLINATITGVVEGEFFFTMDIEEFGNNVDDQFKPISNSLFVNVGNDPGPGACPGGANLSVTEDRFKAIIDASGSSGDLMIDYGDGQSGELLDPSQIVEHIYDESRNYIVKVAATDPATNCTGISWYEVSIEPDFPETFPSNSPTSADLKDYLNTIVRPQLEAALTEANNISEAFTYEFTEHIDETRMEADYGDALYGKAWIQGALASLHIVMAYETDEDIDEIERLNLTIEDVLNANGALLTLDAGAVEHLSAAKNYVRAGLNSMDAAIVWMMGETDDQSNDFITLDDEQEQINAYRADIADYLASLDGPRLVGDNEPENPEDQEEVTIDASKFFAGLNLRGLLPSFSGDDWTGFLPDASMGGVVGNEIDLNEDEWTEVEDGADVNEPDGTADILQGLYGEEQEIAPPSPDTITDNSSLGMTFVKIPAGTFLMGSPEDELGRWDDETQYEVILTQDYYMMTTEVTQAQWEAVMGSNPSAFTACGGNCPVESVSWDDIQLFIAELNSRDGRTYRLPTEAEWEYAARAGTTTAFYNGDITNTDCSPPDSNLDAIGWYCGNSDDTTHPVAQKLPNAWGIYDMSGNVWEWCQDWYGDYPSGSVIDPTGPSSGPGRVLRGGGWDLYARDCRSADRGRDPADGRFAADGFRLVLPAGR